jgi:hypothetical protein
LAVSGAGDPDEADDPLAMIAAAGAAIVDGVERTGAAWSVRNVDRILDAWGRLDEAQRDETRRAASEAGTRAATRVAATLRRLLELAPADQHATPLEVVRSIVVEPTALLRELGVPEVVRDDFDERAHPDDVYDLAPRTLGDLDPELGPELLVWGIAKSKVLRAEAQRGRPAPE